MRVALQMDALDAIQPATDSTLLIGREAERRGYALFHYTPDKLAWCEGKLTAHTRALTFTGDNFALGKEKTLDLATMDVVWLRQDPPFDMAYISSTYLLEKLPNKTLVLNNPASVRDLPEKLFPSLFPQFTPPTLVTSDPQEISRFRNQHKDIVIKPLYGHGGHGVLRLKKDDGNFGALMEMIFANNREPWIAQKFLPEVKNKEARIILIDGKFAGMVGRIPAKGEIRSNFRVGGTAAKAKPSKKQLEICEAVGAVCKKKGLIFVGLDVIGDFLTEINITSPTGMAPINRLYGKKLEAELWDAVEGYL